MYTHTIKSIKINFYTLLILLIGHVAYAVHLNQFKATILQPSNAIAGGQIVDRPMFWVAAIYTNESRAIRKKYSNCTGEFISNYYVLTAAHCTIQASTSTSYPRLYVTSTFINHPPVMVEAYIFHRFSDVVLLKLSKPFWGIEQASFYHGYYVNNYLNKEDILYLFGYGLLGPDIYNIYMHLYYLGLTSDTLLYDTDLIKGLTNLGQIAMFGDSGGPITYIYPFQGRPYTKVVGVYKSGIAARNREIPHFTSLSQDILQWISQETGRIIFKDPSDNEYVALESNAISISGWGKFPHNGRVLVHNEFERDIVAQCGNIVVNNDEWSCQAKFNNNYNFENYLNYQVNVINSNGDILDFVNFKITRSGLDLKILHPNPDFIYHTPINYTYLISGTGAPGQLLSYKIVDLNNKRTNLDPCINDDAKKPIPHTGIWECRVKVINNQPAKYRVDVRYTESFTIQSTPSVNQIVTAIYNIEPKNTIPTMIINSPKPNTILFSHMIDIKFQGLQGIKKTLQYNLYFDTVHYTSAFPFSPKDNNVETQTNDLPANQRLRNKLNSVTLAAYVFIDSDNQPIASNKVDYFIATPLLELTSPPNDTTIKVGENISIAGKAFYYVTENKPVATNTGTVKVKVNYTDKQEIINFGCEGSIPLNPDGTWSCPKPLVVDNTGSYNIGFKLYDINGRSILFESSININVKSIESVAITSVAPNK